MKTNPPARSRGRRAWPWTIAWLVAATLVAAPRPLLAQAPPGGAGAPPVSPADPKARPVTPAAVPATDVAPVKEGGASAAPSYVIGTDDVLSIVFWREKEMSDDVVVRPDGKVSVPLLGDMQAAGLTPEQLRASLAKAAGDYLEEPSVAVIVKQINSLRVFITGEIVKPGAYRLTAPTTVMQLIALAGGLKEFADRKNIVLMRLENGRQSLYPFNYEAFTKRRNVRDNLLLKPGDTVIVP